MTKRLHITPELVENVYELLRMTPPFNRWKLPHADEVKFHIIAPKRYYADHSVELNGTHLIRVSAASVMTLSVLTQVLAHEMIHLKQAMMKARDIHGKTFQKMAMQVCLVHHFDIGTF